MKLVTEPSAGYIPRTSRLTKDGAEFPLVEDLRVLQLVALAGDEQVYGHTVSDEHIFDLAARGFLQQWPWSCGKFGFHLTRKAESLLRTLTVESTHVQDATDTQRAIAQSR